MAGTGSTRRTGNLFFAFAPWIVFDVVAGPSTWKYAALSALVASVVLNGRGLRRGHFKILEATGIVFFAVLSVLALVLDHQDLVWLETYAQPLSSGVIAVVCLGSLAFVPFTSQYARESTPRERWDSPAFRHINLVLTSMWSAVFVVTAVLGLVAVHAGSGSDWLNWVIPIALLVIAVRFTERYPDRYVARQRSSQRGSVP
ncbi:hypothetical protein ELQ87_01055 [Streptomyces griseoviridis]|uniref:DUF3159 domain-containing protein n=1 Tax=Streptomyces griseoviridis TaxID=45398 RepID=A0A3S9Z5I5_STRGD|nr:MULTISPECIES: hypothetical protein [Streptomyces]AZS83037.1 hypothetical protein ELQ87_01055 [Streptomyces griseoviridis]MDH6695751.1 hypothetical protein [Streptomyces sp. MAA16]QCN90110.1 hypothetical protein DDJ31_38310 [Streptomyces griseoviridis]